VIKSFLFIIIPVILGLIVFSVSLIFLSKNSGVGAMQVTSSPISQVYLNGKFLGKSPICRCEGKDMLSVGQYTLKLVPTVGDNLSPYEEHITITKGVLTVVDREFGPGSFSEGSVISLLPLEDRNAIELFTVSFPVGANVKLDGNIVGTTPFFSKSETASDHDLQLSKDGYKDKTIHIHTTSGYKLTAVITLSTLSQDATSAAVFQIPTPSPIAKIKITILDTPTGFLRVRESPSLGASETAKVKPGDTFDYLDQQDGWYKIQLPDGTSGWVNSQYVTKQ